MKLHLERHARGDASWIRGRYLDQVTHCRFGGLLSNQHSHIS